jgi:LacI family transcriptional regulator
LATIRDVARAAGVSIATVSRVFNNHALVSDETARKVLQAAASFDYWPNEAAKSLTTNRSHTFGVLLPDLFGEFYSEVIRGIDHQARRASYQILLSSSHASSEDLLAASRAMLGRVDGLVIMAPDGTFSDTVERIRKRLPIVLLNPGVDVPGCCTLSIDNFAGARTAVAHLVSLGHRRLAMISGPRGNVDAEERLRGFRQALADAGLDPDAAPVEIGDFRETAGHAAGQNLLALRPRPTAVFAANDSMAIGLISAARELRVDIPGEVAVVGFDDVTIARYLNPPLTTVAVDAYGLGQQAVKMMLAATSAEGGSAPSRAILPTVLAVRESCGAQRLRVLPESATPGGVR